MTVYETWEQVKEQLMLQEMVKELMYIRIIVRTISKYLWKESDTNDRSGEEQTDPDGE